MITSSSDRNALIIIANITFFISIVLTAIYNQRFAFYIPSINLFADINLFLLVAVLFADKFDSTFKLLIHTIIYGMVFDIYYTNSIGLFTLFTPIACLIASIIMERNSDSIFFRVMIIIGVLLVKDIYMFIVHSVIDANFYSFDTILYRMIYSVPYNTIIYIILFNLLNMIKRYREITYSNV